MPDLTDIGNIYLVFLVIVPGLIIVYVRSQFISGRIPSRTENILGYFVLSVIYYALTLPIFEWALGIRNPGIERVAVWTTLSLLGPAIFGLLLGAWAQKEWGIWIANKLSLSTVHVIPAAWDWRFSKIPQGGMFVMVTLTTGEAWRAILAQSHLLLPTPLNGTYISKKNTRLQTKANGTLDQLR
jgi:hypothetical protein